MSASRSSSWLLAAGALVVFLAAGSTVAIAAANGVLDHRATGRQCSAPALPGTIVDIELSDMGQMMGGGSMMGGGDRMMRAGSTMAGGSQPFAGMVWITTNRNSIPAGTTSFRVTNRGGMTHELIVIPLRDGEAAGVRTVGADSRVAESSSVGEASRSCSAGEGEGITPGATSWVTLTLAPGRYELLCNLPGHYAAGMFTELTVT
jgi:uncharacterized cupredoxin-like copper-binding protein